MPEPDRVPRSFTSLADLLRAEPDAFTRSRAARSHDRTGADTRGADRRVADPRASAGRRSAAEAAGRDTAGALSGATAVVASPLPASLFPAGVEPLAASAASAAGAGGAAEDVSEVTAVLRQARLFRAALADALDAKSAALLGLIAQEVLGREMRLGATDVAAIVRRIVCEREADGPIRVRVAPANADVAIELPVIVDAALAPGDAVLECRAGSIDARFVVRLALVLSELGV